MNGGNAGALIAAMTSLGVAVLSLVGARGARKDAREVRASDDRRTADAARAQVEAEAFGRARQSYEKIVADLERQVERSQAAVDRVQDQLSRVQEQLAREQDTNSTLRTQVRAMQDQITVLQGEIDRSRELLAEHQRSAGQLRSDLRDAGVDLPES